MGLVMDEVIAKVQADHEQRKLECKTLPKKRRGKRKRLRPNTAIISYAALGKMLKRIPNAPELVRAILNERKRSA
jgi:hypothetical protein